MSDRPAPHTYQRPRSIGYQPAPPPPCASCGLSYADFVHHQPEWRRRADHHELPPTVREWGGS